MSYAQDTGYTPKTFDELMEGVRVGINGQFGTTFTAENFVGTNYYKYFYALVQKMLENETRTAEIFAFLQDYIAQTNLKIQRPSVSDPGIVDSFESNGYVASVKPIILIDAGTVSVCVDTDSGAPTYAATKLAINTLLKDYVAAGIVTKGTEVSTIVLTNGQAFDFKFYLPTYIPAKFRITLNVSENNLLAVPDDATIRQKVFDAIKARYRLGYNFEPQRYFTQTDAPWAESVLLEWSSDAGATWHSNVYDADFKDLFTFTLADIAVTVNA